MMTSRFPKAASARTFVSTRNEHGVHEDTFLAPLHGNLIDTEEQQYIMKLAALCILNIVVSLSYGLNSN